MKKLTLFSLLVLLVLPVGQVLAGPTTYEDTVGVYTVFNNLWWNGEGPISTTWDHTNPYPGDYEDALATSLICGATLTVTVDDLDLGHSAGIWFKDKDGVWRDEDLYGNPMYLDTMGFKDDGANVDPGPGNPTYGENHITSTTFDLDPYQLDGSVVRVRLDWTPIWCELSQLEVESSTLGITTCPPVIPAPGAILLSSIGVGFVGWLRRQRRL